MKITQLTASNVKRLVAVEIRPDPKAGTVEIVGRNAQGKSSVLDSIWYALGGKPRDAEPVRRGTRKAQVKVRLGDDLVVTRTITPGGGGTLTVTDAKGAQLRSPQTILDDLVGKLTFDPLAFLHMAGRDQVDTLKGLVGLDFAKLDAQRQTLYDRRAEVGRDIHGRERQIEAMPFYMDAPATEVSVATLAGELELANTQNRRAEDAERNVLRLGALIEQHNQAIAKAKAQLAQWQKMLAAAESAQAKTMKEFADAEELSSQISAIDIAPIRKQIANAETANSHVRANAMRKDAEARFEADQASYASLTTEIEAIDAEKTAQVAAADMPIEGLALTENGVLFNGLPFEQASSAEQLRVSVAMGLAMNPKLRVLLIRDGSLLDAENLAMVADMASAADGQVWIERVAEGGEAAVVIEDGRVANAEEEEKTDADE